jgi:hypothetical protein
MKHHVTAILFVVVSTVVLMGLNRKRMPQVSTPVSEVEHSANQINYEAHPPEEEINKKSGPFSNGPTTSTPAKSSETMIVRTADQNTNAGEAHPRILASPRDDLSPRLISLITNQLGRLGPLEEERYDRDDWHKLEVAKMHYAEGWGVALLRFAEINGGKCPETLDQASQFYPQEHSWLLSVFDKDRFEVVYHGSLHDLSDPSSVILVRETAPTVVLRLSQHWWKTYIYGNGVAGMKAGFHSTDEFTKYENRE